MTLKRRIKQAETKEVILFLSLPVSAPQLLKSIRLYFERVTLWVTQNPRILFCVPATIIIIHFVSWIFMTKNTHFKQSGAEAPHVDPRQTHLKENTRTQTALLQCVFVCVNSSVKRLFTILCSQSHKPLDTGYIYFSCWKMSLKQQRCAVALKMGIMSVLQPQRTNYSQRSMRCVR